MAQNTEWDREAAEARLAAITPGKWIQGRWSFRCSLSGDHYSHECDHTPILVRSESVAVAIEGKPINICTDYNLNTSSRSLPSHQYSDGQFLANAPDDLRHAFDLLKEREAEIERLKMENYKDRMNWEDLNGD